MTIARALGSVIDQDYPGPLSLYLVDDSSSGGTAAIAERVAAGLGLASWGLMAALFQPTLHLYGQPWPMAFALPVAALFYAAMTVDSARRHTAGQGGLWKGRVQAPGNDTHSETP